MKADTQSEFDHVRGGLKAKAEPRKKLEESVKEEHITPELTKVAFLFFYRFSRFEFALKENGFLKNTKRGARAEPNWDRFVSDRSDGYRASSEAQELIEQAPRQQVVEANCGIGWADVNLDGCRTDLERVARLVRTVRNNLFHGGKHGDAGWDDPKRSARLLRLSIDILDQIAEHARIEYDCRREY